MNEPKVRKPRKTKTEKRYKFRYSHSGTPELECPSCQEYIPASLWWSHQCKNPIVKR